jgi:hypothetical protein
MSIRKLFSTIFGMMMLSALVVRANAQLTEQAVREQARNTVRSQLNLRPDQFLGVQRDETLEQSLALAVGRSAGSEFIYKVSPTGYELKENAIVHHFTVDGDYVYIIAISPMDGATYRISGFVDSLAEFAKLMTAVGEKVSSPDQAESLADFYRKVNPENHEGLTPILGLLELKQAGERQCQSGAKSFGAGEKAFTAWWDHATPLYAALPFQKRAVTHGSGYLVEWIVLSSPSGENCGGAPLRVQLEVSSDGQVGKVTFSPLRKASSNTQQPQERRGPSWLSCPTS